MRGVCRQAGVTARYFYESFTDKDDFVAAVYDWVIADIAASTQAAVAAAPPRESEPRGHGEHRRGPSRTNRGSAGCCSTRSWPTRYSFASAERPAALTRLYGRDVGTALGVQESEQGKATAHFAVAGVAQAFSAWLDGDVALDADQLVDHLAAILDSADRPEAVRGLAAAVTGGRRSASVFGAVCASASVNSFTQQANSSVIPSGSWK